MEEALQHETTTQRIGLSPASPGNHPSDGPKTGDALTFKMDHSSGADHQGCGGGEADRHALLTSRQPEAKGNVRLARAAWAKGNDVLAPLDPFAAGQFQHLHLVELRDGAEV